MKRRHGISRKTGSECKGATLQNYNTELVKHLEEIRGKREDINNDIMREENERNKIESEMNILKERLSKINRSPLHLLSLPQEEVRGAQLI